MSLVNQETSKRLMTVHGWSGVILGLFLYVVVVTGAVAVMAHEIGEWSIGGAQTHAPLEQPLNAKVQELAKTVDAKYREDISIFANPAGSVQVFFHTHGTNSAGNPDDLGVRFMLAPGTLEVMSRDEGFGTEMPEDPESALEHFITQLHISLHVPDPWGVFLTGILGFVMLAAVISGIILHKHLLKDMFVAPRFSSLLLNRRDRHILAGSWSLPFGFILAFTGAFFSFASAIGLPLVAMVSFGGDQVKMFETLVGAPEAESGAPAKMANLDPIFSEAARRAGNTPQFVGIVHWGTQDAKLRTFHGPVEGEVEGSSHVFDLVTGEYERAMPALGTKPSAGATVFAWMAPLHFGHFGGWLSKIVWVSLGLATCYVTLTGLQLWAQRREASATWRMLSRAIPIVGYGVPIGLIGSAYGFFLSFPESNPVFWTAFGFIIGCALSILAGVVLRRRDPLSRFYQFALGGGMAMLPLVRLATADTGWSTLMAKGELVPVTMDLLFLIAGIIIIVAASRWQPYLRSESTIDAADTVPAE